MNLGLVLCARPESGLCQMPAAFSLSEPWLGSVCRHRIQPLREGTDRAPCRPGTLRTGADYKPRCLTWGSAPYAAGESCVVLLPCRLRTHSSTASGPVSHRASLTCVSCRASESPLLSVTEADRASFYYLRFNYHLGCGLKSCPELCSVECLGNVSQGRLCLVHCGLLSAVLAFLGGGPGGPKRQALWHE